MLKIHSETNVTRKGALMLSFPTKICSQIAHRSRPALFLLSLAAVSGSAAYAAQPEIVTSVAALAGGNWGAYPVLRLQSYYSGGVSGGGTLVLVPGDTTSATDNCAIFVDNSGHRFYRELNGTPLDVTMCGAHWDNSSDDADAITYGFTAAARLGSELTCPGGTGKIGSTVTPKAGVIFRCQGMEVSFINGGGVSGPCFYLQNPNGTAEVQSPSFYEFPLTCGGSVGIQLNSVAGGFTDTSSTQQYMMRPKLTNVTINGGATAGFQCSKCFDGDISLSKFVGGGMGVNLEGSDWMSVGSKGANRFVSQSNYPIAFVAHGTFGNGDVASHNDILAPANGVGAYIYSTARSVFVENNFLEGTSNGTCEINLNGGIHATVTNNQVTDATVSHWLCAAAPLVSIVATGNQTSNNGGGGALIGSGSGANVWYNATIRKAIVHYGNFREDGFPFNTQAQAATLGNKVLFDATPSTYDNISNADYGASVLTRDNAYVLPALSSYGSLIDFTAMPRTIIGTVDACFYASSSVNGTALKVQFLDGGVPQANGSFALATVPKWYCWSSLPPTTGATFKMWNDDTVSNGVDNVYELTVTAH